MLPKRRKASMGKFFLFLFLFLVFKAMSQELSNWVRIDCGSPAIYYDEEGLAWQTDENYIKTGENRQIPSKSQTLMHQWRTLRVFKAQNKNCYTLPAPTSDRYFIRAIFNYANYDGLSNPPTFDLEFDGNKWVTVETSMEETAFYEVIYPSKGHNISVCLARTQDEQYPFISMLEAWSLPDETYSLMSLDMAWINQFRLNYGAIDGNYILGYPFDALNRIWLPEIPDGLDAVNADFKFLNYTTVERPPDLAIIDAVQAPTDASTIDLSFEFEDKIPMHQVIMYFSETNQDADAIRTFDMYVNDVYEFTVTPQYQNCTDYMVKTRSVDTLDVQLVPTSNSTLPPIISAIEIYTGIYPVIAGTSRDDLNGLAVLINRFLQLEGWNGEPCLPSDTVWEWLGCTGVDPPRVNSMYGFGNLSGYNLSGPLPDFSQMQALAQVNLSNNDINGPIPDFLGKLPNLRVLDLRNNFFSENIPESIIDNKKLTYYLSGNPNLQQPNPQQPKKESNSAMIIGLTVGLVGGLLLVILLIALVIYLKRKRAPSDQEQAIEMGSAAAEGGNAQGQTQREDDCVPASIESFVKPSPSVTPPRNGHGVPTAPMYSTGNANGHIHANEHYMETNSEVDIPVDINAGTVTHPLPTQEDDDDLNELLVRHGSSGARHRA